MLETWNGTGQKNRKNKGGSSATAVARPPPIDSLNVVNQQQGTCLVDLPLVLAFFIKAGDGQIQVNHVGTHFQSKCYPSQQKILRVRLAELEHMLPLISENRRRNCPPLSVCEVFLALPPAGLAADAPGPALSCPWHGGGSLLLGWFFGSDVKSWMCVMERSGSRRLRKETRS